MALEHTLYGDGDGAGLFRDYDDHRVRLLAQADTGPVPHAEILAEVRALCEREDASRGGYPAVADYDRAVMQRSFVVKQVFQQLRRRIGIYDCAGAHNVVELDLALEDYERAGAGGGHLRTCQHCLRDGLLRCGACDRVP